MNVIFVILFKRKRSKLMKNIALLRSNIIFTLFICFILTLYTDIQLFAQEYKIKTIVCTD